MVVRDHLGLIGFAQRPRAVRTPLRIRLHHAVGIGRKRARHPRVTAACLARPLGPAQLRFQRRNPRLQRSYLLGLRQDQRNQVFLRKRKQRVRESRTA